MQFVGVFALVFGYGSVYTAVRMLKRPGNGAQSGSVLYWITGIDSLGAPSGSTAGASGAGSKGSGKAGTVAKNQTLPTGRGTHSQ